MRPRILKRVLGRRGPQLRAPAVRRAPTRPDGPSSGSVERLADNLRREGTAQRARLHHDLERVDSLLQAGEREQAAELLAEYEGVLRAYAAELERIVAQAVVVREAEAFTAEAAADDDPSAPETEADTPEIVASDARDGHADDPRLPLPGRVVLRTLAAAGTAVVVGLAALVPSIRTQPPSADVDEILVVAEQLTAARDRLLALSDEPSGAVQAAVAAHELHDHILGLHSQTLADDTIRAQIDEVLALEAQMLEELAERAPEIRRLLSEIRALRASLELDVDPAVDRPDHDIAVPDDETTTDDITDEVDDVVEGLEGVADDLGSVPDVRAEALDATDATDEADEADDRDGADDRRDDRRWTVPGTD